MKRKPLAAGALILMAGLGLIALAVTAGSGPDAGLLSAGLRSFDLDDFGRRQAELKFLKAALDRMENEEKRNPGDPAAPSLQAEQQAVLARMREVARPIPAEALAPELRPLLTNAPPPSAAPPQAASGEPPAPAASAPPAIASRSLETGLGPPATPDIELGLSRDPTLAYIVLVARPRPKLAEHAANGENSAGAADKKPAAKPRAAEKQPAPRLPPPPRPVEHSEPAGTAIAAAPAR